MSRFSAFGLACLMAVAALSWSPDKVFAQATDADALNTVNKILTDLTPALNKAWPPLAVSLGLDPYENVYSGSINLKCAYGGDEICGLQASSCEKMWADITVQSITGIANMQFANLTATSADVEAGDQICPYEGSAKGGLYSYSYNGSLNASANFLPGSKLTANVSRIKVTVKCNALGGLKKFNETLFSGSATCTATTPSGKGTFQYCGGTCNSGPVAANLSYTGVDKLSMKVGGAHCDVKPDYNPASEVAEALVPLLKNNIISAITPPVKNALNDLFASLLPYPAKCAN